MLGHYDILNDSWGATLIDKKPKVDYTQGVYLARGNHSTNIAISYRENVEYKYRLLLYDESTTSAVILQGDHQKNGNLSDGFMAAIDQHLNTNTGVRIMFWFGRTHGTKVPFIQSYKFESGLKCAI